MKKKKIFDFEWKNNPKRKTAVVLSIVNFAMIGVCVLGLIIGIIIYSTLSYERTQNKIYNSNSSNTNKGSTNSGDNGNPYSPNGSASTYTITWKNWDGSVLETDNNVPYGSTPTYNGATPIKPSDNQYSYTFSGWSPTINSVNGNKTYTAEFTSVVNTYTITWKNWDGSVLETDNNVPYGSTPTYNGSTPTKNSSGLIDYSFSDWSPIIETVTQNVTYTAQFANLKFGSYPQTEVTDTSLKSALNTQAGTLPSSSNSYLWANYGYYINSSPQSYMWYQDITYGGEKYRGVYFENYRPDYTMKNSSTDTSYQDNNGYNRYNTYWFKWEPIKWKILKVETNKALIIADLILDSQDYHYTNGEQQLLWRYNSGSQNWEQITYTDYQPSSPSNGDYWLDDDLLKQYTSGSWTIYSYTTTKPTNPTNNMFFLESRSSNNYEDSHIRQWLNDSFYNIAFTSTQKTLIIETNVDNSVESAGYEINPYVCDDTNDKIFLLSYKEATTYYSNNSDREEQGTDYAKAQGLCVTSNYSYWWLRSPNDFASYTRGVSYSGAIYAYGYGLLGSNHYGSVSSTFVGVRPALWIDL